jgi:hypothetical protein
MIQPYRKPIWLQLVLTFLRTMQMVITPDSGEEHLYWPLILRGVGLWLLFVPTTLSLSTLKKVEEYRRSSIYWDDAPGGFFGAISPLYRSIQSEHRKFTTS